MGTAKLNNNFREKLPWQGPWRLLLLFFLWLFLNPVWADDFNNWSFSVPVIINTKSTGANVSGTVTNFPVLIRITDSNKPHTDFWGTGTQDAGQDLRFAKTTNPAHHFPYQIERWDNTGKLAEIWVLLDSVKGNDSLPYLTMFWGNGSAGDSSSSTNVFATSNNFSTVWHMSENAAAQQDATSNNNDGTRNGSPTRTTGLIGYAQNFDETNTWYYYNNSLTNGIALNGDLTFSAWVKYVTITDNRRIMELAQASADGLQLITSGSTWANDNAGGPNAVGTATTTTENTGNWHYMVVTRTGSNSNYYLYTDSGTVEATVDDAGGTSPAYTKLYVGNRSSGGSNDFVGNIDEVVVSRTARSSDWINLCYKNQKATDALTSFGTFNTPTLTSPLPNSRENFTFSIDFNLPFAAVSKSVLLTFTRTGGTADANSPHIVYFKSGFETVGQHATTLTATDLSNNANVDSVYSNGVKNTNDALVEGTTYTVKIQYDKTGPTTYNSSNTGVLYDNTAPTLSSVSPTDNSINVNTAVALTLTFSEGVKVGSGNITINDGTFQTISVSSGSVSIGGTGNKTVTITPNLLSTNSTYYIEIAATCFTDSGGNAYAGIVNDNTAWSFSTSATNGDDYNQWTYSAPIVLNTKASGANVSTNVTNFPVLIRITDSNKPHTDFWGTGTQDAGQDLRFAKTSSPSTHFKYQIERWDNTSKLAEVWVLVDSVKGSDSSAYITMYWGNASAIDSSSGSNVFTTSNGFVAVWHLGESSGSAEDATSNNNDGSRGGSPVQLEALIGKGQTFAGAEQFSNSSLTNSIALNGDLTISAWVKYGTVGDYQRFVDVAQSGGDGLQLQTFGTTWYTDNSGGPTNNVTATTTTENTGNWHYVVATRNGAGADYFVYTDNGTSEASQTTGATSPAYTKLIIGNRSSTGAYFSGNMDEVVLSNVIRSDAWIALSYQNQKATNALVTIGTGSVSPLNWLSSGFGVITGAAITEDAMYIGSESDTLYKINTANGARVWTYDASSYGNVSAPSYAYNTTTSKYDVFFTAGNYFIGVQDDGTSKTNLFAVNISEATGPPYVEADDNYVYFASTDNIHKRSKTTGANAGGSWPITATNVSLTVAPVVGYDEIHFAFTDSVKKYDMSGVWQNAYYCNCTMAYPLHLSGNSLIIIPSNKDSIIALNRSNYSRLWGFDLDANNTGPVFSAFGTDTFYVATGTKVQKIGVSGSTATRAFEYTSAVTVNSGPIMPDNMLWFGGASGYVYKLSNSAGSLQTNFPYTGLGGNVNQGPWVDITYNQMLFGTSSGQVGSIDR